MRIKKNKVLLLIDWDNMFLSLFNDLGQEKAKIKERIKSLIDILRLQVGDLIGGSGFVFSPRHLSVHFQQMCHDNNLKVFICPKQKIEGDTKQKDIVDENIMWFANLMASHSEVKYICLVSGDSDYIDTLRKLKKKGLKIALVIPTINSFSKDSNAISLVDCNPNSDSKMLFFLDKII